MIGREEVIVSTDSSLNLSPMVILSRINFVSDRIDHECVDGGDNSLVGISVTKRARGVIALSNQDNFPFTHDVSVDKFAFCSDPHRCMTSSSPPSTCLFCRASCLPRSAAFKLDQTIGPDRSTSRSFWQAMIPGHC